jgi:hypothetical protein
MMEQEQTEGTEKWTSPFGPLQVYAFISVSAVISPEIAATTIFMPQGEAPS